MSRKSVSEIKTVIAELIDGQDPWYFDRRIAGMKLVHQIGGGEGEGEHVCWTWEFEHEGEIYYFEKTGFYESDNGTEWDSEFYIVEPREVVVTQYFVVKE